MSFFPVFRSKVGSKVDAHGVAALRRHLALAAALSAAIVAGACSSSSLLGEAQEDGGAGDGAVPMQPGLGLMGPGDGGDPAEAQNLASMRIEPEDAVLQVTPGAPATQAYRVFGTMDGAAAEVEITDRTVFHIADNFQLGSFENHGPVFETNSQSPRGGVATVVATAASSDGSTSTVETTVTVVLDATMQDPRDDGTSEALSIPDDAASLFGGSVETDRAPTVVYPNDGTLLPPNLRRLEVHFRPGPDNSLFEVSFTSSTLELRYFMRCGPRIDDGCAFELDEDGYRFLAESNRHGDPVRVRVRGTDDDGDAVGESEAIEIAFARTDVRGALYYWTTSPPTAIMRFDFGGVADGPEVFIERGAGTLPNTCVGCHAISPDGTKIVASLGGQNDGRLVYVNDMSRSLDDPDFFTRNGDPDNRIQFASFNPEGDRFVAIYGDTGLPERNMLWFHDGDTGVRIPSESFELPFEPDHPDWSPDGTMIAMSRVGIHNTSQRPYNCGIELIRRDGGDWSEPETIVPRADEKNRFNPSFVPDSSFFVFTESTCPEGTNQHGSCNGDDDPSAKTWAVRPEAGAAPVFLERAAAGGIEDGDAENLHDTFPRSSPFVGEHRDGEIYWITISSRRRAGLRNRSPNQQLLWMFAVDPEAIRQGRDGSHRPFFLPFQDLETSNHIAQWTQRIVTDEPRPEPPGPPPPPEGPPPPPPPPR